MVVCFAGLVLVKTHPYLIESCCGCEGTSLVFFNIVLLCSQKESNFQPFASQANALPIELCEQRDVDRIRTGIEFYLINGFADRRMTILPQRHIVLSLTFSYQLYCTRKTFKTQTHT